MMKGPRFDSRMRLELGALSEFQRNLDSHALRATKPRFLAKDLGSLSANGGASALGLNNAGQVVGYSGSGVSGSHAIVTDSAHVTSICLRPSSSNFLATTNISVLEMAKAAPARALVVWYSHFLIDPREFHNAQQIHQIL